MAQVDIHDKDAVKEVEEKLSKQDKEKKRTRFIFTQTVRRLHNRWVLFSKFNPTFALTYLQMEPPYAMTDSIKKGLDEKEKDGIIKIAMGTQTKAVIKKIETVINKGEAQIEPFPTEDELESLANGFFEDNLTDDEGPSNQERDSSGSDDGTVVSPASHKTPKRQLSSLSGPKNRYSSESD